MLHRLTNFIQQTRRVLLVSSKPDKEEFKQTAKITGIGILIIGIIGFLIFIAAQLVGGI